MRVRPSSCARLFLACLLAASAAAPGLRADDLHLAGDTVFVISTGDAKAMQTALESSDVGRLLADPEMRRITDNLKKGFAGLMEKGMQEAAASAPEGTDPAALQAKMKAFLDLGKGYFDALCEDMSGRAAFSLGIAMDPTLPTPVPNVLIEFGGTDRLHAMHGQLIDSMLALDEGGAKKAEFAAGGFQFLGMEEEGLGLYIGRKGERFVIGTHRGGLTDYITAWEAGTERLGAQPFYKNAIAATGSGQLNLFVALTPLWNLATGMAAGMPVEEGQPNPMAMVQSLGLTDVQGISLSASWTPQGASSRSFISMNGRRGLLRLVPTENLALAIPPFAPADVISANTLRLELSQILNVIRDGMALAPEASRTEFEAGLVQAQAMLGSSVDELLGDLEGTVFNASAADAAPMNPMAMMMGGGMGMDLSYAFRLKSKERFQKLFATLADPAGVTQGMLTKQDISGREAWSMVVPMGAAPMQLAFAIDGEWLIVSTGTEGIRKSFERADSGTNLAGNAAYNGLVQRLGGATGMMIGYTDTGKSAAQGIEMLRPILGMIPLFVPDLQQSPELLFVFDPANLPSGALFEKYLGATVSRARVTEGGLFIDAWAPTKSAPKAEEPKTGGTQPSAPKPADAKPAEAGVKPGSGR